MEFTLRAGFVRRIALVFGILGIAVTAITTVQRDGSRRSVIVARVVVITVARVAVGTMVVPVVIVAIALAVVMAVVVVAVVITKAGIGGRAVFGASASPAENADDGKHSEQGHPVFHSSILQLLNR
jgi:hypothetical protein